MIEHYIKKIDELCYIWFSFYKLNNLYQCIIYTNDNVSTPSGIVEDTIDYVALYKASSFRHTKEKALSELVNELDYLYDEFNSFNERTRLEEDKSIFSKYVTSPYHAVLCSKRQYLYLLDKYYIEINFILNITDVFKETSDIKFVRERLKYAKKVINIKDFSNMFFWRNFECISVNDAASVLISMSSPYVTLDELAQDCVNKMNDLDSSGYINQWILRAFESVQSLPKRWPIDNRGFLYPNRRPHTIMTSIDREDIICLSTNVNREV